METELINLLDRGDGKETDKTNPKETAVKCNNTLKGIIGACFWGLSIAVSKICVQILDKRVPCLQLNAWRFLISGCVMSIYLTFIKTLPIIRQEGKVSAFKNVICKILFSFDPHFTYLG